MKLIKSTNYDNANCILVYSDTKRPVLEGDKVEKHVIKGGRAPHKPGSSGRVHVKAGQGTAEYFPNVVGAEWMPLAEFEKAKRA